MCPRLRLRKPGVVFLTPAATGNRTPNTRAFAPAAWAIFAAIITASPCPAAFAAQLEEVNVNSTAIEEAEAEAPTAFVTVIEPGTGKGRVEDVAEVLKEAAGVSVQSYGGLGSFSTIMIRGASSGQVGVFVDGAPIGDSRMGTVDLSTLAVT
ncbi:MAG: TonB-dependent receptor plug domain-containing protein, partial [Myxococcota bacterium]